MMQISDLADHPEFISVLSVWVFDHWRPLTGEQDVKDRTKKFRMHCNKLELPIALVAHDEDTVFGTAALRVQDLPGREDLSPWLGGVFVGERYRGRGIGKQLCAAVEDRASSLFIGEMLYLFTLDKQAWYTRQGWNVRESCDWCGQPGLIMEKRI